MIEYEITYGGLEKFENASVSCVESWMYQIQLAKVLESFVTICDPNSFEFDQKKGYILFIIYFKNLLISSAQNTHKTSPQNHIF